MIEGYLQGYIDAKLTKGGKKDMKAAEYAGQLRDLFGDEAVNLATHASWREFIRMNRMRLGVEVGGIVNRLSRNEIRFLYPLVLEVGSVVDGEIVRRSVNPEIPITPQNLSTLYSRVRNRIEPDPLKPRSLLRIEGQGFMLIGFDGRKLEDYVQDRPEILGKGK